MPDHRSKMPSRVTLEDLLRLKRAECPPPEFWAEFERELHQKQLAALVERKSWWHALAAAYSKVGRLRLPVGAAAVLALTFLSLRYSSQPDGDTQVIAGGKGADQLVALATVQPLQNARPVTTMVPVQNRAPAVQTNVSIAKSVVPASEAPSVAPRQVSELIPTLGDSLENQMGASQLTPSERSIAVNFATATVIEPELVDAIAHPLGFEERAMPAMRPRHTAEVLPTAAAATEPRRARLLASLGSAGAYTPEPSAPEHAKRSVTRYLAQDGWDRSISRLEAEGNRLSIRF